MTSRLKLFPFAVAMALAASALSYSEELGLRPDSGLVSGNVYTNQYFGFSYEFPKGWHVHSKQTHQRILEKGRKAVTGDDAPRTTTNNADQPRGYVLLTVTQNPEGSAGNLGRGIGIVASDASIFAGIKTGEDYLLKMIQALRNTSLGYELLEGPVPASVGGKQFFKTVHKRQVGDAVVYQAALVTIQKGYVLMLTFAATSKDSLDELLQTRESITFQE